MRNCFWRFNSNSKRCGKCRLKAKCECWSFECLAFFC